MRRVLIAPDKFKGTLSAPRAARAMEHGLRRYLSENKIAPTSVEIIMRPLADGGEGSHAALRTLLPELRERQSRLPNPRGETIDVAWLKDDQENYYLETALAVGLMLPGSRETSILDRTSAGVGIWLGDLPSEAREARLFLGGSAISDGGFGLARALGIIFRDAKGNEMESFRDVMGAVCVEFPKTRTWPRVIIHTDVQSPLTGPRGAARLFAAQKGARPEEVEGIEERLEHMLALFRIASGDASPEMQPAGSGAAGGIALPLLYWPDLDAKPASGIDFFLGAAGIPELPRSNPPDLVITGEGCTDKSTLEGKVVEGLRRLCEPIPCLVFSGIVRDGDKLRAAGYTHARGTDEFTGPFPAGGDARERADRAAERLSETVFRGLSAWSGAS